MNLKQRNGGFLCVQCGEPIKVKNAVAQKALEAGLPALCVKCLREKGGDIPYAIYIDSDEWREKAEEAKQRAGYRCQVCNRHRDEVTLDAHHRTYERLGREKPMDITVLCRDCHTLFENAKHSEPYTPSRDARHYLPEGYETERDARRYLPERYR